MKEEWRSIQKYEGHYEVSSLGRIKSLGITTVSKEGRKYTRKERILKIGYGNTGYANVALLKDGVQTTYKVHRLVAEAFIDNVECKKTVNHNDGDKSNNSVPNLQWSTYKEQMEHAIIEGLSDLKGESNNSSKLTTEEVLDIRDLYSTGNYTQVSLSDMFNVAPSTISNIVKRKRWNHV